MNATIWLSLALALTGGVAGVLGALLGLGGGVFLVPALTLLFGLPIRVAVGTALLCVIATSAGVGAVSRPGRSADYGLAVRLELTSTVGALAASAIAGRLGGQALAVLFAVVVLAMAVFTYWRMRTATRQPGEPPEVLFRSDYRPRRWPAALALTSLAGALSGLTGTGGGFIKAPVMYSIMDVPLGVATATSNFMVGVTAAASALVYFSRGDVYPVVAAPSALGVFLGAITGARLASRIRVDALRRALIVLLVLIGLQMLWKGVAGG
jgi:hypothetical protein